ncbi:MAG: toxin TcdB middle/N-terminal domain-containing protein [Myxococcota bacterium]
MPFDQVRRKGRALAFTLALALALASSARWGSATEGAGEGAGGGEHDVFAALRAEASANLFTGAAALSIPILLPPGRKLATPELALRYSSQSGLSFVGLGWSLPLGVISRAIEQGTPGCDGPDPARFRLTLGASSNDLVRERDDRFLLAFDEGFAEAIPDRAANAWRVRTRDGLLYVFGGDPAARVYGGSDRFHDPQACALTTAWYVTRLEDPSGNTIEVDWERAGQTPLPRALRYGGNAAASIPHPFRVRFESEALADAGKPALRTLASGVDQRLLRRIRRIVVEARERGDAAFEEIRRYELEYDDSLPTADFLLAAVAATDLPTRRFGYASAEPTIVEDVSESVPDPETLGASFDQGPTLSLMDLNGDALLDRLCVDGGGDWHAAYGETGTVQFTGYSACSGAGNWSVPSLPGVPPLDRISRMIDGRDVHLTLDLDGDGLVDLVRRVPPTSTIEVYRGRCASARDCGFESAPEYWTNPHPASDRALRRTHTDERGTRWLRDLVDLNGDGRPDLVAVEADGSWRVHRNTGRDFETVPRILPDMDTLLTYAPTDDKNAAEERQFIDVNDDGLVDWVRGVDHRSPREASWRIPELYFGVAPDGMTTGPFPRDGGPYLCPPTRIDAEVSLCTGANALPAGWAIVGAATVRLNTGSGFADPVATPAPFWQDGDESANRLRAAWVAEADRKAYTYRDFVDANGDGRIDWVTSGHPYDGSEEWFVLYNLGDGTFGGGLTLLAPARDDASGFSLGRVRPARSIGAVADYLGRSFRHSQPADRVDRQLTVLDIDADGLPERVKAFGLGGGDRWQLDRLRFADASSEETRPLLLTRIEDGVGGVTHLRYAPSSRFVPAPEVAPRLPFVLWLLTGIRRTDGLCDVEPADWYREEENPCLAAGHELVQRFEYEEGVYDGRERAFLGFARARVFEGPAGIGSVREVVFHQSRALRGKQISESLFAGGDALLSRTLYDWRTVEDGVRTQVWLQEQRIEEHALDAPAGLEADQCVVHRNAIRGADGGVDPWTRIQSTCSMACAGAGDSDALCTPSPIGKKQVDTRWAEPVDAAPQPVFDRPTEIVARHVDETGALVTTSRVRRAYDGLASGLTDRGHLTLEQSAISEEPEAWALTLFEIDDGAPTGPGNVTAVHVPVAGEARMPARVVFDPAFSLHPIRESAWVSNAGAGAERRIERRFDLRHGEPTESVGLLGRGAGDVAGTVYDGLGRPVCEYAPGTSCGATSGFGPSAAYRYAWGTPGASDPIERLSRVELRRREPNAEAGFLTTRTYFDAFGRERLTTREDFVALPDSSATSGPSSAPPASSASAASDLRPALQTIVVRHLDYAPNGRTARLYAPYVAPASGLALEPPVGTPALERRYVLNGDGAGRLDPAGRVHETIGFDGGRSRDYYYGRVHLRVEGLASDGAPSGATGRTWEIVDEHGRVVERRAFDDAGGELSRWNASYDGRDRIVAEWFGGAASTRITRAYDLMGRAVATDDPDAGLWRIRHDEAGNEVFRDDPRGGQSVQSCYDGLNRIVLQCARASDEPDPGLCAAAQPACLAAWRYRYDESTPLFSTARHGLGRLTSVEGPEGGHRWAYDVRGRVVVEAVEIRGEEAVTRYAYPADLDRLEGMTYPDGEIVRYGYDAAGRPSWLAQVDAGGRLLASYVRDVVYDLFGRPLAIDRGNGTSDLFAYHGASEGFALARLTTRGLDPAAADPRAALVDLVYRDYDAQGRVLQVDDLREPMGERSMSARYGYDAVGRLRHVEAHASEAFGYDGVGNLIAIDGEAFERSPGAASALGPHQFDRLGRGGDPYWTFEFDENGRRKAKRRSDGSFVETYAYDAFGAMWSRTTNGVHTVMAYDHTGRRVLEVAEGVVRRFFGRHAETVNGRLIKHYMIGDRMIALRSDDASVASSGWTAPAVGATAGVDALAHRLVAPPVRLTVLLLAGLLLALPDAPTRRTLGLRVGRTGALGGALLVLALALPVVAPSLACANPPRIRHLHLDHRGSPIAITHAFGALERQYRYSAFGKVRRFDGTGRPSASDPTHRGEFGGYDVDERSGLQYAGSRYYDPSTASFLTPDPADEQASPYAFVGWDPINAVDPNGAAISLIAAILLAVSAVLVVAGAIVAGVRTGSASIGLQTLGIGLASLAAGYVVGLAAPAAATAGLISQAAAGAINASLSVAAVGSSVYGLAVSEDATFAVLAGAGLALSLAGAAFAIGSLARPQRATPATAGGGSARGGNVEAGGDVVSVRHRTVDPRLARQLAVEAQRRLVQIAQQRALDQVQAAIEAFRARYAGQLGIDVYAEVLIEGPRIPHPTELFGQHLLPNRVEVNPTVVPTGRPPTPALLAPVPWDRFRIHEFIPVLRDGRAMPAR